MGVSGSGKSYLGQRLAQATNWPFAEGDDYHSEANKAKMHAGIPLTDADRIPWLDALHQVLLHWQQEHRSGILACSALKVVYRERLTANLENVRFLWLDPPRGVLEKRMQNRPGHFMPPALLDSQLATIENPIGQALTLRLDGSEPIDQAIRTVLSWLNDADTANC